MFVSQEVAVGTACAAAQARFANLLRGAWLTEVSKIAYDGSLEGHLRVGPAAAASKLVAVRILDPVYRDGTMSVVLRWEATGAAGGLFPVLDANISLSPAGEQITQLALAGSYRPPFGRIGSALDRAILHRVATATIHTLLRSVTDAITSPDPAVGHAPESASLSLRVAPESGTP
jgi:hypothetical protein